jgi:hypothetical protein
MMVYCVEKGCFEVDSVEGGHARTPAVCLEPDALSVRCSHRQMSQKFLASVQEVKNWLKHAVLAVILSSLRAFVWVLTHVLVCSIRNSMITGACWQPTATTTWMPSLSAHRLSSRFATLLALHSERECSPQASLRSCCTACRSSKVCLRPKIARPRSAGLCWRCSGSDWQNIEVGSRPKA